MADADMTEWVIQRAVFPADLGLAGLYCRLAGGGGSTGPGPTFPDRRSVRVAGGTALTTDTYFNSFFECYWRRYTRIDGLRLRLSLAGAGTVRVLRRPPAGAPVPLTAAVAFDAAAAGAEVALDVPGPAPHWREAGALHFELMARSDVCLRGAAWAAVGARPEPVRLVAGYCTFDREAYLLNNLRALLDDPAVAAVLERIVVVDQGMRKVRQHPGYSALPPAAGAKVRVVEQGNFGGAGGFTRAILEAAALPAATHVLLMDDDAVLEPESVFRAAAFLALAREDLAVGGANLDLARPLEMHEAGGKVEAASLRFVPHAGHKLDLTAEDALREFLTVDPPDYNAWWFFAFSLDYVGRVGLPLPLFIRGDDIEFGRRLAGAGIPSVTLPGLGVWHEAGYVKPRHGAWYPYYNLRNLLVLTTLHAPVWHGRLAGTFLARLLARLLALDYYEAALLCEAVEDFCRGPEILDGDPGVIHQKLLALKRAMALDAIPRGSPLPAFAAADPDARRAQRGWLLLCGLLHQLCRPSPPADAPPAGIIAEDDASAWSLGRADVVAVDNPHVDRHLVLRRSRATFLALLRRGLTAAARLYRAYPRVKGAWRLAAPRLSGHAFWRAYLGGGPAEADRRAA